MVTKSRRLKKRGRRSHSRRRHQKRGGDSFTENCHPSVTKKNKVVAPGSCMATHVVLALRDDYNRQNPSHKIELTDPKKIWIELKKRRPECKKESCLIAKSSTQGITQKSLYAPKHDKEWIKKPSAWLSDLDIEQVLKQYEVAYPSFVLLGPTSIDFASSKGNTCIEPTLCPDHFSLESYMKQGKTQIGIVFNTDTWDGPGQHWIAMYVDLTHSFLFYFDSQFWDNKIPNEIADLEKRIVALGKSMNPPLNLKCYQNRLRHQKGGSECGMYCLYFIITMITRKINNVPVSGTEELIRHFTQHRIDDDFVFRKRKEFFNEPNL